RVVVGDDDDVGAAAALDGRRQARLDVVLVDALDRDLHARLLAELLRLLLEHLVRRRDEVRPLQEVQPCALCEGGGGAGRGENAGGGSLQEVATGEAGDGHSVLLDGARVSNTWRAQPQSVRLSRHYRALHVDVGRGFVTAPRVGQWAGTQ